MVMILYYWYVNGCTNKRFFVYLLDFKVGQELGAPSY